ncbi:MAG: DNA replication and repair protein RecF [Solirubrobacteraceae bacterium]
MRIERIAMRDFRSYEEAELALGPGLTIVYGANGAGKTNLVEALYFGCTARSFRTANERNLVRFGASAARVVLSGSDADGPHELAVGFSPGEQKRMSSDGAPVERLSEVAHRPLASVFSPDRLELIKGQPGLRRAHLDQFVAALWPGRAATRRAYLEALAQRNALLGRVRAGRADAAALEPWNMTLAEAGVALAADRAAASERIEAGFARHAQALGIAGAATLAYRPRSRAGDAAALAVELAERLDADLARGYTTHGPHRDDLVFSRDGRELRAFGSQGEQRLALLALLLAERDALAAERARPPLMLLDDVMSELDLARRELLAGELRRGGQSVVTATELEHVPGWDGADVTLVAVP